jgi:hypothetical protein
MPVTLSATSIDKRRRFFQPKQQNTTANAELGRNGLEWFRRVAAVVDVATVSVVETVAPEGVTVAGENLRTNSYSVPLKPGSIVEARVSSTTVEFRHHGSRIASHERCYSRLQKIFDLEHYLDVLDRKPGALRGSTPLAQWRAQGRWPESYDRIWQRMIERQGRQPGTRAMVTLIRMGREFGYESLTAAVEQALDLGCEDVAAVRHLLMSDQLRHTVGEPIEIGTLSAYERPLPSMIEYDRLLQAVQA